MGNRPNFSNTTPMVIQTTLDGAGYPCSDTIIHPDSSFSPPTSSRPHHHLFDDFGHTMARAGSYLCFVGGQKVTKKLHSDLSFDVIESFHNDVSLFHLSSSSWSSAPSMNKCRFLPVVIYFDNILYVFGSAHSPPPLLHSPLALSRDTFCECLHLAPDGTPEGDWTYLSPGPPEDLVKSTLVSHAVDERNGVFYFWGFAYGVYSYNVYNNIWTPFESNSYQSTFHPDFGSIWSTTALVLDSSYLVWHYFGTIYAYNFSDDSVKPLYKFRKPAKTFGKPKQFIIPPRSYLHNLGNNRLCLLDDGPRVNNKDATRCNIFHVGYTGDTELVLTHERCVNIPTNDHSIMSAVTMKLGDFMSLRSKRVELGR